MTFIWLCLFRDSSMTEFLGWWFAALDDFFLFQNLFFALFHDLSDTRRLYYRVADVGSLGWFWANRVCFNDFIYTLEAALDLVELSFGLWRVAVLSCRFCFYK